MSGKCGQSFNSFGCKYYRIGNGHETTDDLVAEEAEFMAVIEELLSE